MHRRFPSALWSAAAVLVGLLTAGPATAAVRLEVHPEAIHLAAGESTSVLAVLTNEGDQAVEAVSLSAEDAEAWAAVIRPQRLERLEAGEARAVEVEIRRSPQQPTPGQLLLAARWRGRDGSPSGVEVASLEVSDVEEGSVTAIAAVAIETAVEKIEDRRRSAIAHVVVTNNAAFPIELTAVRAVAPYFLRVSNRAFLAGSQRQGAAPCGTDEQSLEDRSVTFEPPWVLPPGSSRSVPFLLCADAVEPGQHMVVWEADLRWRRGEAERTGSLVAHHVFAVGVIGESTLTQLFKWPSLLLLPGALMVLTFLFLRRRVYPRGGGDGDLAANQGTEFWLPAVTLSLLASIAYPWITGRLGDARDFLVLYSFDDIVNLWLGSVVLAVVAWATFYSGRAALRWLGVRLTRLGRGLVDRYRRYKEGKTLPQPGDDPLTALGKVAALRQKLRVSPGPGKLELAEVEPLAGGGTQRTELVLFDGGSAGLWVIPPVGVAVADAATGDRVLELADETFDELVAGLRRLRREGKVTSIAWKQRPDREELEHLPAESWKKGAVLSLQSPVEIA